MSNPVIPEGQESVTLPQAAAPSGSGTVEEPLWPGRVVERYVVLQRLGKGGMGVVYAAYDPQLDRKVAIKILRPDLTSDAPRQRLLREAQAMARVTHPNVMRVYDVGTADEMVFMAMELVEGETLGEFLERTKPSWKDALRLLVAAGRGLAAAHAAGLVHRDFKPANVQVGADGAPRVLDFGVARSDKSTSKKPEVPVALRESSGPIALESQLTQAGAVVGTPHYMAPEQMTGQVADARSDQFSFCVAAYEALYGERPFNATTLEALFHAIAKGEVPEPKRGAAVPARVRRALMRGLHVSPQDRWPSMEALLAELDRDPGASFRRNLAAALAVGLAGLGVAGWQGLRTRARQECVRAGAELSQVWNDQKKLQLHQAFTATQAPFAETAWSTTEGRLDAYAQAWSAMRTEACVAANVEHTQTSEQLALRVSCLSQRQEELAALISLLSKADAKVARGSVAAAHALTSVSGCADLVALRTLKPPPADPASRAQLDGVRSELAAVKSLSDSGEVATALARARNAESLARASGFAPVIAEALVREGELQDKTGDRKTAEKTLQEAVWFAQLANADELAARAWNQLGFLAGYELDRHQEGETFCRYAEALIERQGSNPELMADNLRNKGLVLEQEGRFDDALEVLQESLSVREKLFGPEHPLVATSATSVGNAYIMMSQYEQARPFHERALAIRMKLLGPNHPDTATSWHNLAICLTHLGQRAQAIELLEKSLAADSAVFGAHSDHAAQTRHTLGKAWFESGQLEKGRVECETALEDLRKAFGPESPTTCPSMLVLGEIAADQGRWADAKDYFTKGLAIRERQMGKEAQTLGGYLLGLGEVDLAAHQPKAALEKFERAGRLKDGDKEPPEDRAAVAFGLARARWDSGGDKARALDEAALAKKLYAAAIDRAADGRKLDAWLETHRR